MYYSTDKSPSEQNNLFQSGMSTGRTGSLSTWGNFSLTSHTSYLHPKLDCDAPAQKTLVKLCPHSVWGCRQNSDPLSNLLVFLLHKIMDHDIHKLRVNRRNFGYLKCVLKPDLKVGIIAFYITLIINLLP